MIEDYKSNPSIHKWHRTQEMSQIESPFTLCLWRYDFQCFHSWFSITTCHLFWNSGIWCHSTPLSYQLILYALQIDLDRAISKGRRAITHVEYNPGQALATLWLTILMGCYKYHINYKQFNPNRILISSYLRFLFFPRKQNLNSKAHVQHGSFHFCTARCSPGFGRSSRSSILLIGIILPVQTSYKKAIISINQWIYLWAKTCHI